MASLLHFTFPLENKVLFPTCFFLKPQAACTGSWVICLSGPQMPPVSSVSCDLMTCHTLPTAHGAYDRMFFQGNSTTWTALPTLHISAHVAYRGFLEEENWTWMAWSCCIIQHANCKKHGLMVIYVLFVFLVWILYLPDPQTCFSLHWS